MVQLKLKIKKEVKISSPMEENTCNVLQLLSSVPLEFSSPLHPMNFHLRPFLASIKAWYP